LQSINGNQKEYRSKESSNPFHSKLRASTPLYKQLTLQKKNKTSNAEWGKLPYILDYQNC
jgi:hypothetical protein